MYFHKKEWEHSAIFFYAERTTERDFYWGISNYSGGKLTVSQTKLDCFHCKPNEYWPYGWEYLSKYRDWDMNTIAEMINGHYMDYITKLVLTVVGEIDKKGLPMP